MNTNNEIENKLINEIDNILKHFRDFEQPYVNNNGDIIIRRKVAKRTNNDLTILTNIFKEVIYNDEKKTGFKTLFRICYNKWFIKIKISPKIALKNQRS